MNPRQGLERIVVVGGGIVALTASIAFARALPQATVDVVALPLDPAALADRLPALDPRGLALLARLGITEPALVAAGAATHRVGTRFAWGAEPFPIGEGDGVPMLVGTALHQLWRVHGESGFDTLVPAAALASADCFVHPPDDPRALLSHIDYTLRLDPDRAAPQLAALARAAGVRLVEARSVHVNRDPQGMTAIVADGRSLTGDLFVDASGPAALLASPDAAWIDWRPSLAADRLLLASTTGRPSPTDRYEAAGDGWTARWPLAGRTLTGFAYAGAVTNDARARRLAGGDHERVAVHARRQRAPFSGNVLALGDAAAAIGPLGWLGLPLALAQLDLALELMPACGDGPWLAAEYNRRAELAAEHIHAYAAAFYLAGSPRKGPFWHSLHGRTPPEELASALAQFGRRGTLPPLEEAMLPRAAWYQALIGLGIRPERPDPVALSVPRTSAIAALAQLRTAVAGLAAPLPSYPDYLARLTR